MYAARLLASSLTALLLCPLVAWGMPEGTIVMKDGRRYENVRWEIQGDQVMIHKEIGSFPKPLSEVGHFIEAGAEEEGGKDGAGGPSTIDWETRFRLEVPEGWSPAEPANPMIRAQLAHDERKATLAVSVRPAEGEDWEYPDPNARSRKRVPRELQDAILADLATQWGDVNRPKLEVGSLFASPVFRMNEITVTPLDAADSKDKRMLTELRFRQFGFEYAISYWVTKDDQGALQHQVDEVLEAFSFLPTMEITDDVYSDYVRGFALRRPNADWDMRSNPFSPEKPLRLLTDKGRGQVQVHVIDGGAPEGAVNDMIQERKKRGLQPTEIKITGGTRGGSQVTEFVFQDFKKGGKKWLRYEGFAAQIENHVVMFLGISPLSDQDSKKIQGEVGGILGSVRLYDRGRITATMGRAKDLLSYLAQGREAIDKSRHSEAVGLLDQALAIDSQLVLAYVLRAQAKKELHDFSGYREDLERAAELDPEAGYDRELAAGYEEEANVAQRDKDYRKAMTLYIRCFRSSKDEALLKKAIAAANKVVGDAKREKKVKAGIEAVEGAFSRSLSKRPEVIQFLAKSYKDAANSLIKEKEWSDAKKMVRKMKRLDRKDERLQKDAERMTQQIDRAKERGR